MFVSKQHESINEGGVAAFFVVFATSTLLCCTRLSLAQALVRHDGVHSSTRSIMIMFVTWLYFLKFILLVDFVVVMIVGGAPLTNGVGLR